MFEHSRLKREDPLLHRRMLYEVACLFLKRWPHTEIAQSMKGWVQKHAKGYCDPGGPDNINTTWVYRRLKEAIRHSFLRIGDFEEDKLMTEIHHAFPKSENINITLAPNADGLMSRVWAGLDAILCEKVSAATPDNPLVIGVSGGMTMLAVSAFGPRVRSLLRWHQPGAVPPEMKENVIVCSLTSGGMRDNIAALSDTVAASLARELGDGVKAHGLLGPAVFPPGHARDDFVKIREVKRHIQLVKKAGIVLTSAGYVHDDTNLTAQIIRHLRPKCLAQLRSKCDNLSDILYNCYDGRTGEPIPYPRSIEPRILTAVTCADLQAMVASGQTKCFVVTRGYDKGFHALPGIIIKQMATDIYMDIECANGLIKAK